MIHYIYTQSAMKQTGLIANEEGFSGYYPALDTLRFLAVFGSFLHHSHLIRFIHGHTFFFVLAAFILTLLAQKEYAKTKQFSFFKFTMRRLLRIVPLYFLLLFVGFVCVPLFFDRAATLPDVIPYLTFTANYIQEPHVFLLAVLWAVSVQEQFYVFIGICFRFFYRLLPWIAVAMICVSVGYKYVSFLDRRSIYFETLNHFSSFGVGILLAIGVGEGWFEKVKKVPRLSIVFFYALLVAFFSQISHLYAFAWFNALDNVIVSLLFSVVILTNTVTPPIVFFAGKSSLLDYFGKISYGLYCYQGVIITFGLHVILPILPAGLHDFLPLLHFLLLLAVAHVSYQFFEKPFLNLKSRFRSEVTN